MFLTRYPDYMYVHVRFLRFLLQSNSRLIFMKRSIFMLDLRFPASGHLRSVHFPFRSREIVREKEYSFSSALLNFSTQRTARFYTLACVYARTHEQATRWKGARRKMMLQFARESSRNRAREVPRNIRFTLRWIPMPNIKGREEFSYLSHKHCAKPMT